jgi:uncharacterized membrane protein
MAVTMLLLLLGLVAMLGLVEVGYLYWAKRDTQKVADLAALAGAQRLGTCAANLADNAAARGNAMRDNGFSGTLAIACGHWEPGQAGTDHFGAATPALPVNAVRAIAERPSLPLFSFFPALPTIRASAVASNVRPVAAFSVGTTLLSFDGGSPLGQALKAVGVDLGGTSLVGYDGLAHVNVTPAGLLKALGIEVPADISVGDLNALLASQLHAKALIDILDAVVTVAGQSQLVDANLDLLDALEAKLGTPPLDVVLGSADGAGGLFARIVAPDGDGHGALDAQVNALDLIATAIGVASGGHAATADIDLNLGLLRVTVQTRVIEPPSIAIGGVGATAYSAQLRSFVHIVAGTGDIPLIGNLLRLKLDLPIALDLVAAQATLTDLCTRGDAQGRPLANIAVDAPLLKMCVGNITAANAFSTTGGCDRIPGVNDNRRLLALGLGNVNLLSLDTHMHTDALVAAGSGDLYAGQTRRLPDGSNPLAIGSTLDDLGTALVAALLGDTLNAGARLADPKSVRDGVADALWNQTSGGPAQYGERRNQAIAAIDSATGGLHGFLGDLTGNVLGLLGSLVTLDVPGLLGSVGGLLGSVGNLLGQLLGGVLGTGCEPGLLNGFQGNAVQCKADISNALAGASGPAGNPNAIVGLLGFLLKSLQPILDGLGSRVLSPLLDDLGLDIGHTDVHLQSLQCSRTRLVY